MLTLISVLLFFISSGFLVWFFLRNDRGVKEHRRALVAAASFGLLAIIVSAILEMFLPQPTNPRISVVTLFFVALGVGIIEESAKFIPLALHIKNKAYFHEHTDGVIYFGIAGLTFGLIENLMYVLFYQQALGGSEFTGIFRLVILFFFHAASTGIVGYYFAKYKIQRQSITRPIIALATLAFVHGMYDFLFFYTSHVAQNPYTMTENTEVLIVFALVGGLILSALLNTFLFLYYGRARQWDVSIGLAVDPKLPIPTQATVTPPPVQVSAAPTPLPITPTPPVTAQTVAQPQP